MLCSCISQDKQLGVGFYVNYKNVLPLNGKLKLKEGQLRNPQKKHHPGAQVYEE